MTTPNVSLKLSSVGVDCEINLSPMEREILQPVQYFTFHRVKVGLGATFVRRGITESMKILNRPDRPVRRFLGMTRFRDKVHASTSRRHSLPRIELAARTVGKTDFPLGRLIHWNVSHRDFLRISNNRSFRNENLSLFLSLYYYYYYRSRSRSLTRYLSAFT